MSDQDWRRGTVHDRSGPNGEYLKARAELKERLRNRRRPQQPAPPAPIEPPDLAETGEHQ